MYSPFTKVALFQNVLAQLKYQLRSFLSLKCILNVHQSGFIPSHDVVNCMDKRQHCAALFIDLSNAFDTVDHSLLIQRLSSIGLDQAACNWLINDLTDRTQCESTGGVKSG
jgi:hypothetical protein